MSGEENFSENFLMMQRIVFSLLLWSGVNVIVAIPYKTWTFSQQLSSLKYFFLLPLFVADEEQKKWGNYA